MKTPVTTTIGPAMQAMIDDGVRIRRAGWEPERYLVYNPDKALIFDHADSECFGVIWQPSQRDIAVNGKMADDWMVVS